MKTNTFINTIAAVVLLGAATVPTLAQGHRPPSQASINARLREQNRRIDEGVRTGQLTRSEAARLRAREVNIRFDNKIAHITGGRFTAAERARLEAKLNKNSRAIYHEKHDGHMR